jgi:hypothetical protein
MKQNLFEITQEERRRIIYLHETRTAKHYLTEQITTVETETMVACGTGDLQKIKSLNGLSNDEDAHKTCDNLKTKYPYDYKVLSPNHADSRSAASSLRVQQTGGKKVKQTVTDINYKKFQGFCGTKGLISDFRTWLLTNNPKGLEQLKITDKTTACDTKYYQLWYATLNPAQKLDDKTYVYLGEYFKVFYDSAKIKKEALKAPDIKAEKDTNAKTNYVNKHQGIMIDGQWYDADGETGKLNMVKLGNGVEGSTDIEDWVNLISFALEFIPGFGNLASAIVDIATALVNLVKSYFNNDMVDKSVNFLKGSVGLAMAFVPGAGNTIMIGVKKALSWISNWWKQVLLKVTKLVQNGTITKTLSEKFLKGELSTVLGTICTILMKNVGNFTKNFIENSLKDGINGAINLLNGYIDFPGVQTLIDMLSYFLIPINELIEFINSFGTEIEKIPTNLSEV